MTLLQIKYAIEIAASGSINKASEKLYVSQPSLTASIHALEEELGITIFRRTSRGVTLTPDGEEFLASSQLLYQNYENLVSRYREGDKTKKRFGVSTQHYSFALKSFVEMMKAFDTAEYEFAIRETKTREVIEDVASFRSEVGILYLCALNRSFLEKIFREKDLEFHHLALCRAYVYLWKGHPLAGRKEISFDDLAPYPCLSFEQGEDSLYYAEEILSEYPYERIIKANDRASMLNLMVGVQGYTLCSGVISEELNGSDYLAIPFKETRGHSNEEMEIGYIKRKNLSLSPIGEKYIQEIKTCLKASDRLEERQA